MRLITALALTLATLPALASDARAPQMTTWTNSCASVQGAVNRTGAAVLTYSRQGVDTSNALRAVLTMGEPGWDRVVADARFCLPRQSLTPIWVPARDNAQCFAGYTCAEADGYGGRHSR